MSDDKDTPETEIDTEDELEDDDEFVEPELDEDEDIEGIDEVPLDDDDDVEFTAELPVDDEEEDVPDVKPAVARARTGDEKEEEEDEEVDPDDVEADLDTILKDRLEAYDETEEDEEEEGPVIVSEEGDLPQKREGEFPCSSCFLLVNVKQVARTGYCPHCGDPIQVPATLR